MSITIVADVGSASANSFITEAEQIAYMATRLNASSWTTVTGTTCTETEKAAMIEATRDISRKQYKGTPVSDTQALSHPRQWLENPDAAWPGTYYGSAVIAQRIKDATMELAFQYVKAGTTDLAAADTNQGVISKTLDVISTTWSEYKRPTGMARFPRVLELIAPLLAGSGSSVPLIRG